MKELIRKIKIRIMLWLMKDLYVVPAEWQIKQACESYRKCFPDGEQNRSLGFYDGVKETIQHIDWAREYLKDELIEQ